MIPTSVIACVCVCVCVLNCCKAFLNKHFSNLVYRMSQLMSLRTCIVYAYIYNVNVYAFTALNISLSCDESQSIYD